MTIKILGADHAVTLPDFATREDLAIAMGGSTGVGRLRVCAAFVGLCTPVGRQSGADFAALDYAVVPYGRAVYSYLREQGATVGEVMAAGAVITPIVVEAIAPRKVEVKAKEDFTGPDGAH